jgi:8-oxo-dGTP pyrophosphatase MutT (NUDIX family)
LVARGLIRDTHGRWLIVRPTSNEHRDDHGSDHGGDHGGGHGRGFWHLPGGLVEHNEPPGVACAREIREELALDLTPAALIAVGWTAPRHAGRHAGRHARVTFIFDMGAHPASTLDGGVGLQRSELADWRWAPPHEALGILPPDIAVRLTAHRTVEPTTDSTTDSTTEPTAVYTEHHPAGERVTGTSRG